MSNLVEKRKLTELENKIHDISNLATKTALTTVENEIPDVTNLATKTSLTTVENKVPDISSLVKKTDYNTRVAEIDTKVSNLNGKIAKNKNQFDKNILKDTAMTALYHWGIHCLMGEMVINSIQYLNQYINILKRLPGLIIFYHGNLKDYLLKI